MSNLSISEVYRQSGGLVQWSPDCRHLACSLGARLVVRDANTFQVAGDGPKACQDKIEAIEWAADSDLILCASYKSSIVEVFSLSQPDWRCRIREGVAGLVKATFAPDARHLLTFSDFSLHLNVWSLITKEAFYVKQPKAPPGSVCFSPNGDYMAIASRLDCKDRVAIYDCSQEWACINEFPVDTLDLTGITWSPDGDSICVQDTSLEYVALFYAVDGSLLSRFQPYNNALGIKASSWSPDGAFLAIGSYDESLRLLACLDWKSVAELRHVHPKQQNRSCSPPSIYSECLEKPQDPEEAIGALRAGATLKCFGERDPMASSLEEDVYFSSHDLPAVLPNERPDMLKSSPRLGVGVIAWSHDGRYIASRNDNMAGTLWIWDARVMGLAAIVQFRDSVRSFKWSSTSTTLAVSTGNSRIYFWNPRGMSWAAVAADFQVLGLRWRADGDALLLLSKDRMCRVSFSAGND